MLEGYKTRQFTSLCSPLVIGSRGDLVFDRYLEIPAAISLQSLMTLGHLVFEIFLLLGNKNGKIVTITLQKVISIYLWLKV